MFTLRCTSRDEGETHALGVAIGRALRGGDVVALSGQLGAGKTRLVRGIAAGIGADSGEVSSPTYVISQEYAVEKSAGVGTGTGADESEVTGAGSRQQAGDLVLPSVLVHIDAYRLGGVDDLETIGFDAMRGGSVVMVIEWPEKIGVVGPADGRGLEGAERRRSAQDELACDLRVTLEHVVGGRDDRRRVVKIQAGEEFASRCGFGWIVDEAVRLGAGMPEGWARCPVTGRAVRPECPTFPFIDERARMADLGKWMSGSYVVSRELTEDDLMNPELPIVSSDESSGDGRGGPGEGR